jgi:hypothetical protein
MPRQPYLPTFSKVGYSIGYNSISERPVFARVVGECIAVWSYVDNEMATLLGQLLGLNSEAALEVFLSLRKSSSQREALAAAARHTLKDDKLLAFEALMVIYRSLEAQRNDLAHGCFGYSADDADLLFWIELKHHVHFMADAISKEAKGIQEPDSHAKLKENLFVYRMTDLTALLDQIKEAWFAAFHLNCHLRHAGKLSDQSFAWLCALPQIQQEMSRLKVARNA